MKKILLLSLVATLSFSVYAAKDSTKKNEDVTFCNKKEGSSAITDHVGDINYLLTCYFVGSDI